MTGPRILDIDIETSPNLAHIWSLRDLNVGLNQLLESSRMIGFGYKWRGEKTLQWCSEYHHGRDAMVYKAHRLLDEADALVHYNGERFDVPNINAEILDAGLTPPSPFKNIDLYKVVRKNFRYPSFKLQYVASRLLGQSKVQTGGHQLWVDCLLGDEETMRKAWARMRTYCKQDVALLEPLHDKLTPWLGNQFNVALYDPESDGALHCQKCGGTDLESRGTAYTATRAYPQFRCRGCGGWTRDGKASWSIKGSGVVR